MKVLLNQRYCGAALFLLGSGMIAGCSAPTVQAPGARLMDLPAFDVAALPQPEPVTEQQLGMLYQQILQMQPAASTRQKILYRLSQMHTAQLEQQELPVTEEREALQQLIGRYQQLLQEFPEDPNNELVRYQLARSYDLLGQQQASLQQLDMLLQQYPHSAFTSEALFRKADIHYSRAQYEQALAAYQAVVATKEPTLLQHARYMAGWSYFKLQQFELADREFLQVLDEHFTDTQTFEQNAQQQSLQQEVLRTLSISLSYQQQAESLQQLLNTVPYISGERPLPLIAKLYQTLADFLSEKQLVAESLHSYRLFITNYPASFIAAQFQLTLINHYLAAGDKESALIAQRHYIELFGPGTAFWQQAKREELVQVQPLLLQYLDYFAREQYLAAQNLTQNEQQQAFAQAVPYWKQMLLVLDNATSTAADAAQHYSYADIQYLLAESYAGAAQHEDAMLLYADLGYRSALTDATLFSAQDAAYRALLIAEQLALTPAEDAGQLTTTPLTTTQLWQYQQQFVSRHSAHPMAQQVALRQLQQLFVQQDYPRALQQAQQVIDWPLPEKSQPELVSEALFVQSQSELALQYYADAEQTLALLLQQPLTAQRQKLLNQQYASSIYQQAQQRGITDETALHHLQRLLALPGSEYHEAAAYQQIALLLAQQQWASAVPLLQQFISAYPQSDRQAAAKAQLIETHEKLDQWDAAAGLLQQLASTSSDEKQQQQALLLSADYYRRAGDDEAARLAYRDYANRYPQPHDLAQEARYQLTLLYQAQQDSYRQHYWNKKIASFEQQMSAAQRTERTSLLAAQALLALGQHESTLFAAVALRHPLKQSLQRKRQHMTAAITFFQQSIDYGIATLLSEAQFRVAELYQQMASALLSSDRPAGLDQLALEQYELLLEEQAYPFEEQAIAIYQQNTALTQQQIYDSWVKQSFTRLAQLYPAKFNKKEEFQEVAVELN